MYIVRSMLKYISQSQVAHTLPHSWYVIILSPSLFIFAVLYYELILQLFLN